MPWKTKQNKTTQLAWDQVAQEFHKKAKEIPGMLALRTVPEV